MKKRYTFPALYFEATRMCNLGCEICMTGSNDRELVAKSVENQLSAKEIRELVLKGGKEVGASQLGISVGYCAMRHADRCIDRR